MIDSLDDLKERETYVYDTGEVLTVFKVMKQYETSLSVEVLATNAGYKGYKGLEVDKDLLPYIRPFSRRDLVLCVGLPYVGTEVEQRIKENKCRPEDS